MKRETAYNRPDFRDQRLTRGKAIRLFCVDCYSGSLKGPKDCPDKGCPLWRYRMGREDNPNLL